MHHKTISPFLSITLLILAILACSADGPAAPITSDVPVEQLRQDVPVGKAGGCTNPDFPVVLNASWSYKSLGSPVGEYNYTDTITDLRGDGFSTTSAHDDFSITNQWICTPAGLGAITFNGGPSAGITADQFQLQWSSQNVQGVTVPAQINPGDTWSQSLDFQGTGNIGGSEVTTQGIVVYNFTAIGEESVNVPAGTFIAMKIETDLSVDSQVTFRGSVIAVPSTFTMFNYWAPGVGLVKTETSAEVNGSPYSEVIELQSYNIP